MISPTSHRRNAALALAVAAALGATSAAVASDGGTPEVAQPRVLVPKHHAPASRDPISGCWSGQQPIYGPYAFSFCSNGVYGSYQVRGGGLHCDGSVNLSHGPGDAITVNLSRSPCNAWTDWSADRLVCRAADPRWDVQSDISHPYVARPHVAQPHVTVPNLAAPPQQLDCTYFPAAAGYHPIGLALSRN